MLSKSMRDIELFITFNAQLGLAWSASPSHLRCGEPDWVQPSQVPQPTLTSQSENQSIWQLLTSPLLHHLLPLYPCSTPVILPYLNSQSPSVSRSLYHPVVYHPGHRQPCSGASVPPYFGPWQEVGTTNTRRDRIGPL